MMRQRIILNLSTVLCLFTASASSAEVRNYSFVSGAPAYQFSCGECSGPPYSVRGQVTGTFDVSLDFENGVGTLQSLNAHLNDVEGSFVADDWQPIGWDTEFLNPSSYFDRFRPPYVGVLTRATYRPLGPGSLTAAQMEPFLGVPYSQIPGEIRLWLFQGVGFEPAPANSWILYFDGLIPSPDGLTSSVGASFSVYFEDNHAQLSYYVPIIDATPAITGASASLIPEPSGVSPCLLILGWLCGRRIRGSIRQRCILTAA